jgi:periplasmic copper chaperone A
MRRKIITGVFMATAMVLVSSTAASAHVTVNPKTADPGGYTKLTFRMPNETPDTNTTQLEVDIPTDHPIASVSVQPQPGWSYTTEKSKIATPIKTDDDEITETTSKIVWTADAGGGLKPGEFGEFNVSVGPLPKDTSSIVFKALQTYSNGDIVRWIDTPTASQEAEHPAPTLTLAASTTTATKTNDVKKSDVNMATALGIVGIVVGAAALALTIASFLTRRKG